MAEVLSGYAAKFGKETTIAGEFRERLAPGCFDRTLRENKDIFALLYHDYSHVLGRTSSGTLQLRVDDVGLWFSLQPNPETPDGQAAVGHVRRRDVAGCSFGFRVKAEEWEDGGLRLPLRTITDVDLFEITLTPIPAYKDTDVSLIAPGEALRQKAEAAMRRRGISLN
ncbi:MAG TPA: HK97 family phage prohead protease [Devosia sp.]|uniref:HK97 family phage prohead protease n=1 Tax=Devosia sp. TaxID=1871048 RepID=UPI002F95594A